MPTLTVQVSDRVKALAEARAAVAGCATVGEYLEQLIRDEVADGPVGVSVGSDKELEAFTASRLDGKSVEMDDADFQQMREKLKARLGSAPERQP